MTATVTSTSASKTTLLTPRILSVSKSSSHSIAKTPVPSITLIPNHGVDGDCHAGQTTQHRAQAQRTPNLRQVHLVPVETLRELSGRFSAAAAGRNAKPLSAGEIGENITTEGVELSTLPLGTELHFLSGEGKEEAIVVLTGVREPGPGMDKCRAGLKNVCVVRDGGRVVRRLAGVMGTVKKGGMLRPGMGIRIVKPASVRPLPVV
ncbi:hypothetical protein Aspvir_006342 [Aspergillus viridinutans]|uniref:MOSC domain-containing protein n=1 Tax=Aspergillus viridinutans TaxID=75553 RepID=A0A9P3F5Q0_ASPVI|nr:uncharacterized protein Aspvir_006342 [Aspergillus viridinutans]GIK02293.1 hypothetical protein Aspvir_006342 [Aspergillus viridinutans]